ncbi:hypothetical protein SANA_28550 [Gottschalkiaceae bacterium SANA]|nr:hypothetical protein SANA_28550 [Gottschalkiaceae bacterium SANA]
MFELSIIVPVYNIKDYIFRCIKSMVDQMDDRVQIIIVDDGSKDAGIETILDLCRGYENIEIYQKENGGLSSARNYGIEKAVGKYVYFVDGDDFLVDGVLSDLVEHLMRSQEACYAFKHVTQDEMDKVSLKENKAVSLSVISTKDYLKNYRNPITNVWKMIIRRQLIMEEKLFFRPGVLCEDVEWMTKLFLKVEEIAWIDRFVYVYDNTRSDSIMNVLSTKRIVDLDQNIYQTKHVVDEIEDIEKRVILKKLLFIEWCMNLSFYSRLSVGNKSAAKIQDCFSKDEDHYLFKAFGLAKGIFGLNFLANCLYALKRMRKQTRQINFFNGIKKQIME